jgi:OmpA-OmpF porin, OOP family
MRAHGWGLWGLLLLFVVGCEAKVEIKSPPPPPPAPAPPPPPPPPPKIDYITVSERIQFETDSAILLAQSQVVLGEVVRVLKDNPHIKLVEIGGHTDSTGDSSKNLLLSQDRAESVRAYLMSQGIDGNRMRARGFGDRVPVATNSTPQGREQNRRVEFRIVDQGP